MVIGSLLMARGSSLHGAPRRPDGWAHAVVMRHETLNLDARVTNGPATGTASVAGSNALFCLPSTFPKT